LSGAALIIAGFRGLRRKHTTPNPINIEKTSALVTDGIFAFTRNPIYLGMALWLLAWAIGLGNLAVLPGPLFFVAYITRFQIMPEERVISNKFPADFEIYRKATRRWF
jgi:protein-S-isoprenylcysteine O-methyltransferase Ste14